MLIATRLFLWSLSFATVKRPLPVYRAGREHDVASRTWDTSLANHLGSSTPPV
jgi:hypothetical protein